MNEEIKILSKSEIKQAIIIRKDLKMRRGKEIAQGAHASMQFLRSHLLSDDIDLTDEAIAWLKSDYTKVVLQCDGENELLDLYQKARDYGLLAYLVQDLGKTEFNGTTTLTALAIGPNAVEDVNTITKNLKLY